MGTLPSLLERRQYLHQYVSDHLPLTETDLGEDTLVLHIRSGDIFNIDMGWGTHVEAISQYVQPPLVYYQKIIEQERPRRVIIVSTPDLANPVINALSELVPNVEISCGSLLEDISLLCSASRLVVGFGTFGLMSALLSKRIQKLYAPRPVCDTVYNSDRLPCDYSMLDMEVVEAEFPGYIAHGTWSNSKEQRQCMLEHEVVNFLPA